jgi:kinesin family member 11
LDSKSLQVLNHGYPLIFSQAVSAKNAAIQASTKAVHGETVKVVDAQLGQMAQQMSALDEFVTRARSQNDKSHNDHLGGLQQFQLEVAQLQTEVADTIQQRDTDLRVLKNSTESSTAELSECTEAFGAEAREALQTLHAQVDDSPMQDYVATGETPQKRDWTYPKDLPATAKHETIIARMRGLPESSVELSIARTPGSPRKRASPRKSPTKTRSPKKAKVFTDTAALMDNMTEPIKGLREIDMNVVTSSNGMVGDSHTISFSKSVSGQPPLKRHATANAAVGVGKVTRSRAAAAGTGPENFSQSVGSGGRRLRNSPPQ